MAVAGVLLALIAVRVVTASSAELDEARERVDADDIDGAIVHYRRAARWYAPGNPHCVTALRGLADIARAAEEENDDERALAAWRAVRGGILATRSFFTPHGERLDAANERIAGLMARQEAPPIDAGKTTEELEAEHLALLVAPRRPRVSFTLLLLGGFLMWVVGAFAFASRAFDEKDRLVRPAAARWGLTTVVGFAFFVVGLLFA